MRIGLYFEPTPPPPDPDPAGVARRVEAVAAAERDGFDGCWLADTVGADALTVLALAGARTRRIELGAAVVPIHTRPPMTLARQALTVNAAAGGRLVLGIGPTTRQYVELLGLSVPHVARYAREYLSVLAPLVRDGSVAFAGADFRVAAALRVPGPRPCPILVGALGPRMLRLAGELADGTITWMVGPRSFGGHIAPRIREAAAAAGRPAPRLAVGVPVAVCDDEAAGRAQADRTFAVHAGLPAFRRMFALEGASGPGDVAVCGPEARVERQLRAYAALGASDVLAAIYPVGPDPAASEARTYALLKRLVGRL